MLTNVHVHLFFLVFVPSKPLYISCWSSTSSQSNHSQGTAGQTQGSKVCRRLLMSGLLQKLYQSKRATSKNVHFCTDTSIPPDNLLCSPSVLLINIHFVTSSQLPLTPVICQLDSLLHNIIQKRTWILMRIPLTTYCQSRWWTLIEKYEWGGASSGWIWVPFSSRPGFGLVRVVCWIVCLRATALTVIGWWRARWKALAVCEDKGLMGSTACPPCDIHRFNIYCPGFFFLHPLWCIFL